MKYLDVFHVVLNTEEIFGYSDSNLFAEHLHTLVM